MYGTCVGRPVAFLRDHLAGGSALEQPSDRATDDRTAHEARDRNVGAACGPRWLRTIRVRLGVDPPPHLMRTPRTTVRSQALRANGRAVAIMHGPFHRAGLRVRGIETVLGRCPLCRAGWLAG